jgi:branched-chain amino acid transport system substrate-binding protein
MKKPFALALLLLLSPFTAARAENAPGITDTEIRIGQTMPFTGPAGAVATPVAKAESAYFRSVNDQGGVNGRKLILLSRDDALSGFKALELTRRLIEEDKVAFIFSTLGTPQNIAIRQYLNDNKTPQLFFATGVDVAEDHKAYPWSVPGIPMFRNEGYIFGRYILLNAPAAKIAVLYFNDAFGTAYLAGLHDVFGADYQEHVVKEASAEETDSSVDAQIESLRASGADALIVAVAPKLAALTITGIYDRGWHPIVFITNVSSSVNSVLRPAGIDKSKGLISAASYQDPDDPRWTEDGSLKPYNDLMAKYLPDANRGDFYYLTGYVLGQALAEVLKLAGNDLSRENIMRQATSLRDFHPVGLLPGISFNTNRTKYHPIVEAQLQRFDGEKWVLFGDIMAGR